MDCWPDGWSKLKATTLQRIATEQRRHACARRFEQQSCGDGCRCADHDAFASRMASMAFCAIEKRRC